MLPLGKKVKFLAWVRKEEIIADVASICENSSLIPETVKEEVEIHAGFAVTTQNENVWAPVLN